jgi:hypothetical protein
VKFAEIRVAANMFTVNENIGDRSLTRRGHELHLNEWTVFVHFVQIDNVHGYVGGHYLLQQRTRVSTVRTITLGEDHHVGASYFLLDVRINIFSGGKKLGLNDDRGNEKQESTQEQSAGQGYHRHGHFFDAVNRLMLSWMRTLRRVLCAPERGVSVVGAPDELYVLVLVLGMYWYWVCTVKTTHKITYNPLRE